MTGDFRRIVWTIAHLPASACTTSAPGSKSPLGRGGGGGAARIGVLSSFPVVGVRLCETFLLGGAPCTTGCGKCAKGAGRGDDAARARARNKLADLDKSGAVEPAVWAMIKDAASSRA